MLIKNARIFDGIRFIVADSLEADSGVITRIFKGCRDKSAYDYHGDILAPALIDLHLHHPGWENPEGLSVPALFSNLCKKLLRQGTGAFLCASVFKEGCQYSIPRVDGGAECIGLYLEGPFINKLRIGAISQTCIKKINRKITDRLLSIKDLTAVTVAPELPGALGVIKRLSSAGIKVMIGHTEAGETHALKAFGSGACGVTHLFNAMDAFDSGRGGIFKALAETECVYAELIADGAHVQDMNIRQAFGVIGCEKLVLVSDYTGESNSDGILRGGNKPLLWSCLRLVNELGLKFEDIFRCATANPAEFLGLKRGRIKKGWKAEFVRIKASVKV